MKTLQLFVNTGPSGYGGGRPPILNGTEDEPPCHYYCHLGPCIISLAPSWLVGSSAPGLGNLAKRYTDLLVVPDGNSWVFFNQLANVTGSKKDNKKICICIRQIDILCVYFF